MMEFWFLAIVIWLACGYWAAGYDFALFDFEHGPLAERELKTSTWFVLVITVLGPLPLIGNLFDADTRRHGRRYPWEGSRWIR